MNNISKTKNTEMDSELKLPTGRRELKIGDSLKANGISFHGIKYDFKPSNEEFNESGIMEITPTNQVSVKYPQGDNEGSSDFMYSGTMKPFPKEYFLVIDHVTGEVTLERLTANIQLKRTKVVNSANKLGKNQNKKQENEIECSVLPNLVPNDTNVIKQENDFQLTVEDAISSIREISDDSSSDSDSNSDSSSSSNNETKKEVLNHVNGYQNGRISPSAAVKGQILNEDLQLSESGSDSD